MPIKYKDTGPTDRICANCIYFDKFEVQKREDNIIGACKANPPFPPTGCVENTLGVWPTVLGTFFCGIFENSKGEGFKK